MKKFSRFTILSLAIAMLLIPFAGYAQVSQTTGAIIGVVTDGSGNVLPGVTVTATGPTLQGSRVEVSNAQGEYVLAQLPPGQYRVEYALGGINTIVRPNVTVSVNKRTKEDVPMQMAVTETVTVTAAQVVVDPTQTQTQQNFKEDHLKYASVGSANRSYQSVIWQAPNVNGQPGVGGIGGGNPQVGGANGAQNLYVVDGINTTDPVTHTFGPNLGFDFIQEISILTFGKDAEYRSTGGTVNVVTKSGGNNFSGSFDWRYNDPKMLESGKKFLAAAPTFFGGPPNGNPTLRFNKAAQTNKSSQPQATFGGPIMRDKLWFFVSANRPETSRQAPNTVGIQPGPRKFTGWNNFGKLTFTPIANHTFSGRFIDSYATITNALFSSLAPTEADFVQHQATRTWGLGWDGIINSRWLANVQASYSPGSLDAFPMTGDLSTPSIQDNSTSVRSQNYTSWQTRTSYRRELNASTTYYLEQFGTHAFKVGVNYDKNGFTSSNGATGDISRVAGLPSNACEVVTGDPSAFCGVQLRTNNGAPSQALIVPGNPASTVASKSTAFFVQDQWNPITPLTIRAGLRYDHLTWDTLRPVPAFKLLQPRLGLAYDIFNNGGSVIHAFGGKVIDENQLTLPSYVVPGYLNSATYTFNPATSTYSLSSNSIALSGGVADPDLKAPFSNEYSLGFTQKLFRNSSLDLTAEQRHMHHMFDDFCGIAGVEIPSSQWDFFNQCILTNLPGGINALQSEYRGVTAKLESRVGSRLDLVASWQHATSKASTGGNLTGTGLGETQNGGQIVDFYPLNFKNIFGFTTDDARNRFKLNGFYRLPLDFTVGANYYWDSGLPYSVTRSDPLGFGYTVYLEPRGSRRLPSYSQLDMQLQKDFSFRGVRASLIGSVLNVLNSETAIAVNGNAGTRAITDPATGRLFVDPNQQGGANRIAATFERPTSFQQPRRYEVGVRFEF